ncbi:MAG: potassium channel family protein [Thermodesulfobacteriota bacterium]
MRRTMFIVLAATSAVLAAGVVVFRYTVAPTWVDSLYFVVTTMTTVGYGDYNLQNSTAAVKVFGSALMLAGATSLAAVVGLITDAVLQFRLQEFLGKRRRRMKDHIVLCGLGNVGFRVLEYLLGLEEQVTVVEKSAASDFFDSAKAMGVSIITGDIRLASTLERANIKEARCLIAVSDHDMANLEAALNARAANDKIRIVLRLFDPNLAAKIQTGFGIQTAFSTSALAAPAFAMAAVNPNVIGSFFVGSQLMLNLEIIVQAGSRLDGLTTSRIKEMGDASVLAYEGAKDGRRRFHPAQPLTLGPGDKIVLSTLPDFARRLQELNEPANR